MHEIVDSVPITRQTYNHTLQFVNSIVLSFGLVSEVTS